jgi:hypothetical protein
MKTDSDNVLFGPGELPLTEGSCYIMSSSGDGLRHYLDAVVYNKLLLHVA